MNDEGPNRYRRGLREFAVVNVLKHERSRRPASEGRRGSECCAPDFVHGLKVIQGGDNVNLFCFPGSEFSRQACQVRQGKKQPPSGMSDVESLALFARDLRSETGTRSSRQDRPVTPR